MIVLLVLLPGMHLKVIYSSLIYIYRFEDLGKHFPSQALSATISSQSELMIIVYASDGRRISPRPTLTSFSGATDINIFRVSPKSILTDLISLTL